MRKCTPDNFTLSRLALGLCCALCAGALLFCNSLMQVDGGFGSETTNGKVRGKALLPDGSVAAGVLVMIRKADYVTGVPDDPEKPMTPIMRNTFTDVNGNFVADSMDTGIYHVEINNLSTLAILASCSVLPDGEDIDIGARTLSRYAAIKGEVNLSSSNQKLFVQVCGLERLVPVDSNGAYTINNLPAGTFKIRIVGQDPAKKPTTFDGITASSGSTTTAPSAGWTYSKKLFLNTSASGAGVAGPVYGFPVLVRLTNSNFAFAQAQGNGGDIRFMKTDSSAPLAYEIETWDSANGLAAVWVLADTVFGNNATQSIVMSWGAKTGPASNGAAVFSIDKGFSAVWHLDKGCNDATANGWDGSASGVVDTAGMIGKGKKFNGSDYIEIPGLLGTPATITLSAWAQLDTVPPGGGGEIVSIGDAALIRMDYALGGLGTIGSIHLPGDSASGDSVYANVKSGQFLKQTGWHLLTYTVDQENHNQALYIDGTLSRLATVMNATISYSGVGQNTFIGKHGNGKTGFNFSGRIDEVRVQHVAVPADWIKLCYQNQKTVDALVKF